MALALLAAVLLGEGPGMARGATIALTLVDGRPVARCELAAGDKSIPANVVIDLGQAVPLLVHQRTAELLGLGRGDSAGLRFDGAELGNVPVYPVGLQSLEQLTLDHAAELGEIPAVAILGLPAFSDFRVRMLIDEGRLDLSVPPAASAADKLGDTAEWLELEPLPGGYGLSAVGPDDFEVRVRFGTSQWDTVIDATVADLLGAPGGELDRLVLGDVNLAEYVALRPEDLSGLPEPRPSVVLGTNLLLSCRLTIDVGGRRLWLEPIRRPEFPAEERAYFVARAGEDPDGVEAFLKTNPSSRLAGEASRLLMTWRLDEYTPDRAAIERALRLFAEATPPQRRATALLGLADGLLARDRSDRFELAAEALRLGQEAAPEDLSGRVAHDIQARLGRIALQRGDLKQARRHLLSAAFGVPRDPEVNYWLGQLYERLGKPARAWSRYVQAAISDDAPPEAVEGLGRLANDAAFRASFTMRDAEQLLEGRVVEFHPSQRYAADATAGSRPVRLVELFSCVDHADTQAAELAFGGLAEYLEPADTALVEYHLPQPADDPLVSKTARQRAALYGLETAPVAVFDGTARIDAGGGERAVPALFEAYRQAASGAAESAASWELTGRLGGGGEKITVDLWVSGGDRAASARLHVLVCERAVIAPGRNGLLLHRHVVRGALTPAEGLAVAGGVPSELTLVCDPAELSRGLQRTITELEEQRSIEFLVRPTYIDAGAIEIVAFLQNHESKQVLAARRLEVADGWESTP